MKKTIIFGAIMSAFLVLSMTWLAPVQVKAYEMLTTEEIENKINEMGQRLENDDNFAQIVEMHSNQDIQNIFKQLFQVDTQAEIQDLANEYVDILGKEQLNLLLGNLNQEFGEDLEAVTSSLNNLFGQENTKGELSNYRVEQVNGKLKVTKLDTIELKENSLIFTKEGNIIFPTGQTFSLIDWQKIADFFYALAGIGLILTYAGLIIEWIGIILFIEGDYELGNFLVELGYNMGIIAAIFGIIFTILATFFEKLADNQDKTRVTRNKLVHLIENLRIRLLILLQKFIQRITC
jgi:hypothetical protein